MLLLLVAMLGGGWSYDGFAAEAASRKPAPAAPPSAPGPSAPSVKVVARPAIAPEPAAAPLSVPSKTIPVGAGPRARPARRRLADRSGQVWEHADPDWLRCWVAYQNTCPGR